MNDPKVVLPKPQIQGDVFSKPLLVRMTNNRIMYGIRYRTHTGMWQDETGDVYGSDKIKA